MPRIAKGKFGYDQQFTAAEQEMIRKAVLIDAEDLHFDEHGNFSGWHRKWICDMHELPMKCFGSYSCEFFELDHPFFQKSIADFEARAQTVINQKVNVAVPGVGLLQITEVKVLYDQCTDELQKELRKGWQILAICPQPDQRRPDYIVGKPYDGA